jgi:hypothetical protein
MNAHVYQSTTTEVRVVRQMSQLGSALLQGHFSFVVKFHPIDSFVTVIAELSKRIAVVVRRRVI